MGMLQEQEYGFGACKMRLDECGVHGLIHILKFVKILTASPFSSEELLKNECWQT